METHFLGLSVMKKAQITSFLSFYVIDYKLRMILWYFIRTSNWSIYLLWQYLLIKKKFLVNRKEWNKSLYPSLCLNFTLNVLVEFVAQLTGLLLIDKFGRRPFMIGTQLVSGVCVLICGSMVSIPVRFGQDCI